MNITYPQILFDWGQKMDPWKSG